MKGLGDETEAMRGEKIPLQVVEVPNPETHQDVEALHIAPTEEWDTLIAEFEGETNEKAPSRRRARSKAAKKTGK